MISNIVDIIVLILIIGIVIFIIKAGMKLFHIIIMILLLAFAWFTFFTDEGAARLSILIKGHPVIAYTTKLTKYENKSNDKIIYFTSSKPLEEKYAKCNKEWIVRLPVVE